MIERITYNIGENEEPDFLCLDGKPVAELLINTDSAAEKMASIFNEYLNNFDEQYDINYDVVLKNDDDMQGVILDIYDKETQECCGGLNLWFDTFIDY